MQEFVFIAHGAALVNKIADGIIIQQGHQIAAFFYNVQITRQLGLGGKSYFCRLFSAPGQAKEKKNEQKPSCHIGR